MKRLFILCILTYTFLGCTSSNSPAEAVDKHALTDSFPLTKTPGKLIALLDNNLASYYINKGQPRGFEYEMLKLFCEDHNLILQVELTSNFDYLLDSLIQGKADLAAGNLTVTSVRKELVSFSSSILRTRQVLVQSYPTNYKKLSVSQRKERMITDALDLNGKTIYVNQSSSYKQKLLNLMEENGLEINIVEIDASEGIDELVEDVANGKIDFTILDENLAQFYKKVYPNIYIETPISLSQNIAWAIPKKNEELLDLMNKWIDKNSGSTKWNIIYNRYFKYSSKQTSFQRNFVMNNKEKEISQYDALIKKYAMYLGWDWRLLASLVRKESRFNQHAKSSFGASGLMQVMPNTGLQFGVDENQLLNAELNIKAGTRFLQWLTHFWADRLDDHTDIDYFVIASYNAGPGHVLDAMRLAEKHGLDSSTWFDNVEIMLLNKSKPSYYKDEVVRHGYCRGREPYHYVRDIYTYFDYYKTYTFEDNEALSQTAGL